MTLNVKAEQDLNQWNIPFLAVGLGMAVVWNIFCRPSSSKTSYQRPRDGLGSSGSSYRSQKAGRGMSHNKLNSYKSSYGRK